MGPSTPMTDQDWQAEDDMRTLMRAAEVKASPERVARAKAHASQKAKEMAKVAGSILVPESGESSLPDGFRKVR